MCIKTPPPQFVLRDLNIDMLHFNITFS